MGFGKEQETTISLLLKCNQTNIENIPIHFSMAHEVASRIKEGATAHKQLWYYGLPVSRYCDEYLTNA